MQLGSNNRGDVCIVGGAGHIGLPLALVLAVKGLRIIILDKNQAALQLIAAGELPFLEEGGEALLQQALAQGNLVCSSDPASAARAAVLIIAIGVPAEVQMESLSDSIRQCVDSLLPYLDEGQLLILRSTVSPGTTAKLGAYLQSAGKSLKVAYCPERILQGRGIEELQTLSQIISGTTPDAETQAVSLFSKIAPDLVLLSPAEAELAKLFSNAYRYIMFAVANQFFQIADHWGVDYYRVRDAVQKNYPRMHDLPKAGFAAGPCLYKDTQMLAQSTDQVFSFGKDAITTNAGFVDYIIQKAKTWGDLTHMTVGLLGMAFKANNDDIRDSLSYPLRDKLRECSASVLTTDPFVTTDAALMPLAHVIKQSDLLILCIPHRDYQMLDIKDKPIIDVWNHVQLTANKLR